MTWNVHLTPFPLYSQNASPTEDAQPDENAPQNCGETCVAMSTAYLTGVVFRPDTIHDDLLGEGALGISTNTQLARFLKNRCATPSTSYFPQPADRGAAMKTIRNYLFAERPIFVAQYFSATDRTPHWRAVIGGSGDDTWHTSSLIVAEPWDATEKISSAADFWSLMCPLTDPATGANSLVMLGVDRTRDPLLS